METIKWYRSSIVWLIIIAGAAFLLQSKFGFQLTIGEITAIIVVVNLIMRAFTKQPLVP